MQAASPPPVASPQADRKGKAGKSRRATLTKKEKKKMEEDEARERERREREELLRPKEEGMWLVDTERLAAYPGLYQSGVSQSGLTILTILPFSFSIE
jgi:hypothetical protein